MLFSSHFLPALQRAERRARHRARSRGLAPDGLVTADGREHEVDCIIYGTGFRTTDFMFPMEIIGRDGRTLREAWADGAHAHLGITVPGFPSLFLMYGPNTNTSGGSIIVYLEAQAAYIRQALELGASAVAAIDVRPRSRRRATARCRRASPAPPGRAATPGTATSDGRIVTNWPGYMREYAERTRTLEPSDFRA